MSSIWGRPEGKSKTGLGMASWWPQQVPAKPILSRLTVQFGEKISMQTRGRHKFSVYPTWFIWGSEFFTSLGENRPHKFCSLCQWNIPVSPLQNSRKLNQQLFFSSLELTTEKLAFWKYCWVIFLNSPAELSQSQNWSVDPYTLFKQDNDWDTHFFPRPNGSSSSSCWGNLPASNLNLFERCYIMLYIYTHIYTLLYVCKYPFNIRVISIQALFLKRI